MQLPQMIRNQLAGRLVRVDMLAEFRFADGTGRAWNGFQTLETNDGRSWRGSNGLLSISGLQQSINGAAPALEIALSGLEPGWARLATGEKAKYYNLPVLIYWQFFDEDWNCLDDPIAITLGLMQQVKVSSTNTEQGRRETLTMTAETPFATRRRPRFGTYTDRHQQLRHPGDRGCERTQGISQKVIIFPDN